MSNRCFKQNFYGTSMSISFEKFTNWLKLYENETFDLDTKKLVISDVSGRWRDDTYVVSVYYSYDEIENEY